MGFHLFKIFLIKVYVAAFFYLGWGGEGDCCAHEFWIMCHCTASNQLI